MAQEKNLLLKYLCMALPYGVKIKFAFNKDIERDNSLIYVSNNELSYTHNSCMVLTEDNIKYVFNGWLNECKPYLRPMSSMTKEERKEYNSYCDEYYGIYFDTADSIDWLLKNHFDYRGLIGKGLAIEAQEGMYKKEG